MSLCESDLASSSCIAALRRAIRIGLAAAYLASGTAHAQRAAIVQSIDEPGRTPFTLQYTNNTSSAYYGQFTVPAGQRYVVEAFSAECDILGTNAMTSLAIEANNGGKNMRLRTAPHFIQNSGTYAGIPVNHYGGTGYGPAYADPGSIITVYASSQTGASDFRSCYFSITGHAIANP